MKPSLFLITTLLFTNSLFAGENLAPYSLIKRNYELDKTQTPCNDFHAYICGNVEKEYKLPADRSFYPMAFSDADESILNYKKAYLSTLQSFTPKTEREAALKNFYLACVNADARKTDELYLIEKTKKDLKKIKSTKEMLTFFQKKFLTEETGLIRPSTTNNLDDSKYSDLIVLPTVLSLPEKTLYTNTELATEYKKLIASFFKVIGSNENEKDAEFIFNMEKDVANEFPTPLKIRSLMSEKSFITKKDLSSLKNLEIDSYLNKLPKNILIRSLGFDSLKALDKKLGSMTLDEMKNIYLYINLKDIIDQSHPDYFNQKLAFNAKFLGAPSVRPPRNEECTKFVMSNLNMELDSVVINRMFPNFPKKKVIALAEEIRAQIIKTLKENTWLSKQGREGAIKKMTTAKLYLVSPENDTQWNFTPKATYNDKTPVRNSLKLKALVLNKDYKELGKIKPLDRWGYGPLTMNAYYDPSANHFVLLNAILQAPFFDPNASHIKNLAAIGTVIGHELGHGIDDQGRRYDEVGKLRDVVTPADIEGLSKRTQPLVSQFNSIGHNGALTLGENIGDLVGITNSFKVAFPDYKEGKYSKELLQEFFEQYAKMWCEVQTESFKELRLKTDPHSLGFARINEQVKNQIGFREAYQCKEGDKLFVSEDKLVKIW